MAVTIEVSHDVSVTGFVGWGRQEGPSGAHTHGNRGTYREKDGERYNEREEDKGKRVGWGVEVRA